jgi:(1->4)-alpha-D-glucan 1-alpha-D-glucosylmutase
VTATYRLQLHAGFPFAAAEKVVPYLAELGVTHLYLSPVLQAVPGSMHGYDVVDHTRVSTELGGVAGLESLAAMARVHGLGIVVDTVPNHMALVAPEHLNQPLWQVLSRGRDASTASWFDIDWRLLDGRLGLPVLDGSLEQAVSTGRLTLGEYDGQRVVRYGDHVLPLAEGTDGDDVLTVLGRQHYLLAGWQDKDAVLNYRRFFDVDALMALRVEDPDVFEATHRLLLDLNHRGVVEGFRIDHPDGLADPEGYLHRLRDATRPGTAIWVEKILAPDERLPRAWACDGTTGYDAARVITSALLDADAAPALTASWVLAEGDMDLRRVERDAKRLVVRDLFGAETRRLVRRAVEALPGTGDGGLDEAVEELLSACEVYRAYVRVGEPVREHDRARLQHALAAAELAEPDLASELHRLVGLALGEGDGAASDDFAVRFGQTSGAVMAKGVEDTTYYRWNRMVALNEVGGDPLLLDTAGPRAMHEWAVAQQRDWPLGMTTLSTHDTKRSEDVRARLVALAGDTESWTRCTEAFADAADQVGLDRPTAHLVWQTMVGVGEIPEDRLHGYLVKAVREAKLHTGWVEADPDYEARVLAFADSAAAPGRLKALLDTAVERNQAAVRAAVLGQKLLQLTLPGVPDTYQGCEVVDLSLTDPDNRRTVDFEAGQGRLHAVRARGPYDLADEKLLLTTKALGLRRELRDCFADEGDYQPLESDSPHLVGFLRGSEVATLVTRAPQRLEADGGWGEATLTLPEGLWRDEVSEVLHGGGESRCADLFESYPVALLRRLHMT